MITLFFLNCEKAQSHKKIKNENTYEYIFDSNKEANLDSFLQNSNYKIEDRFLPISKEEYIKDSINFKNNITVDQSIFHQYKLKTPYGQIKFTPNKNKSSDGYIDYSYAGYSKKINNQIININLYEGDKTLLINNSDYKYNLIESNPIFSEKTNQFLCFTNSEGTFTNISIYNFNSSNIQHQLTFWSDEVLIENAFWNTQNDIILKIQKNDNNFSFYKILNININSNTKQNVPKLNPLNQKFDGNWKGSYEITSKAISQYDKKEIDLSYTISIKSDKSAILSIGAEQAQDYWCEGSYALTKENDILHAKGKCDQDDTDDFYLKFEDEKYFIKSKRFLNQDWQELKKE